MAETTTSNETQIKISDEIFQQYKETADKWNPTLLELPIAQAQDVLGFMTGIAGLRGTMHLQDIAAKSEFGPYDPDRVSEASVMINSRPITTYLGSVIEKFHPNDYAELTMGYQGATVGEGQKRTKPTLLVLSQLAKARGEALSYAVFNGVRNAKGSKCVDLFDGFHTIADKEITAKNITEDNKNLYVLAEKYTKLNTCDIAKNIIQTSDHYLRREQCFLFCSQDFADLYDESYLLTHPSVKYNEKYHQAFVEGSNGLVTLCPLPQLEGSKKFYLAPKKVMMWGTDNKSAQSFTQVDRFEPFRLTFSATMFFGVQFRSIDPRLMRVIDVSAQYATSSSGGTSQGGGSSEGGGTQQGNS